MSTLWPRSPEKNLLYRLSIRERAGRDKKFQRALVRICQEDVLFFINTFCWLYEPRPKGKWNTIPFATHEYQDGIILDIAEALGVKDIGVEKSRDLGLTWIMLTVFFWKWLTCDKRNSVSFGLMSRNMDLVDKSGKTDTLFWKLDFLYWHLPRWMRPKIERTHGQLTNVENLSTIEGSPTTGDAFRGGRKTAIGMDEFHSFKPGEDYAALAATQHATDSRLFVSTPKGPSGAYYDVMHDPAKDMARIVCDWKEHPDRKVGMYTTVDNLPNGRLKILDEGYKFPDGYEFVLDGKVRSPYYDRECQRPGATPQSIAQELDRDYGGAASLVFNPMDVARHRREFCRDPDSWANVTFDTETLEGTLFRTGNGGGPIQLFIPLDFEMKPDTGHAYAIGCDVSAGTGGDYSSNSCGAVMDSLTGKLVALYVSNTVRPDLFADTMMALGYIFNCKGIPAKLNWESNGIGQTFSRQVLERAYPNIYYRDVEQKNAKVKTKKPGWYNKEEALAVAFSGLLQGISTTPPQVTIPARIVLEEMGQYIYMNGKAQHSRSLTTQDEAAKGRTHGDTVVAVSLAKLACDDIYRKASRVGVSRDPPIGSMAWRLQMFDQSKLSSEDDWDLQDTRQEWHSQFRGA